MFKGLYTEFMSHFTMIQDDHRTLGFYNAIKDKISPGDFVVDFGSGTGVLAVMCAKLGAGKVYAVEQNSELIDTIKKLAEVNQVSHKIEIFCTTSNDFIENFSGTVDLLVSEGIGDHIFESRLIYDFLDFKDKFKIKKTVPENFELYCYPEYINLNRDNFLQMQENIGLDLTPINDLPFPDLDSTYFTEGYGDIYYKLPETQKQNIKLFEFSEKQDILKVMHEEKVKCLISMQTAPSHNDYLMIFFRIKLSQNNILTNSPKRKKACHSYYQRLVRMSEITTNDFVLWIDVKMHQINIENNPYPNIGVSVE